MSIFYYYNIIWILVSMAMQVEYVWWSLSTFSSFIWILVSMAIQAKVLEILYTFSASMWFHANMDWCEHGYTGRTSLRYPYNIKCTWFHVKMDSREHVYVGRVWAIFSTLSAFYGFDVHVDSHEHGYIGQVWDVLSSFNVFIWFDENASFIEMLSFYHILSFHIPY